MVRRAGHLATSLGSGASAWPGVRRRPGVDAPAGTASRTTGVVIIVTVCVSARLPDAGDEATARWCGRGRGGCSGPAVSAVVTPAGGHGGEATPSGTIRATFGDPPGAPPGRRPVRDQSARCRCWPVSPKSRARFSVVSRRSALPCLAGCVSAIGPADAGVRDAGNLPCGLAPERIHRSRRDRRILKPSSRSVPSISPRAAIAAVIRLRLPSRRVAPWPRQPPRPSQARSRRRPAIAQVRRSTPNARARRSVPSGLPGRERDQQEPSCKAPCHPPGAEGVGAVAVAVCRSVR